MDEPWFILLGLICTIQAYASGIVFHDLSELKKVCYRDYDTKECYALIEKKHEEHRIYLGIILFLAILMHIYKCQKQKKNLE